MRTPSQSTDADSSPLGGAEALAFPRCGAGVNPKAHSVRFEDPAAVSAARLTDEGKQTGDYRRYIIDMRCFFSTSSGRSATTFSSRRRLSKAGGAPKKRPPCVKGAAPYGLGDCYRKGKDIIFRPLPSSGQSLRLATRGTSLYTREADDLR